MALTIVGLFINALPEWRIIGQSGLLPIVAFWGAINIIVLFLVCMMSLQAPVRRGEERFRLDEPIWIFAASGASVHRPDQEYFAIGRSRYCRPRPFAGEQGG